MDSQYSPLKSSEKKQFPFIKMEDFSFFSLFPNSDASLSNLYLQKGIFWAKFLEYIPFVRAVAIVNTVAMGVANKKSDIDFLIVSEEKRLWSVRFFVTLFFSIIGMRRTKKSIEGKICLSFFVDKSIKDFTFIKHKKDIYLAFWCLSAYPVFGKDYFQKFFKNNTDWAKKEGGESKEKYIFLNRWDTFFLKKENQKKIQKFLEFLIPSFFEYFIKKIWEPRSQRKKNKLQNDSGTIISDHILKFHDQDKRSEFQKKYEELLKNKELR